MDKQQLEKEALKLIETMELNRFLLPDSWSEEIMMSDGSLYKTYVGERYFKRYINIEYKNDKRFTKIVIRGNKIAVDENYIFARSIKPQDIYDIIKKVYDEKHSFAETAEGKKSILVKMKSERDRIKSAKQALQKLEKELQDYELLQ